MQVGWGEVVGKTAKILEKSKKNGMDRGAMFMGGMSYLKMFCYVFSYVSLDVATF